MDSGLISCDDGMYKRKKNSLLFFFRKNIRGFFLFIGAYCKRRNCYKRRARNPTTTVRFDYCSLRCLRLDRTEQLERGINLISIFLLRKIKLDSVFFSRRKRNGTRFSFIKYYSRYY